MFELLSYLGLINIVLQCNKITVPSKISFNVKTVRKMFKAYMPGSGWSPVTKNIFRCCFLEFLEHLVHLPTICHRILNERFFEKWFFDIFTLTASTLLHSKPSNAAEFTNS